MEIEGASTLVLAVLNDITEEQRPIYAHVLFPVNDRPLLTVALYNTRSQTIHVKARTPDNDHGPGSVRVTETNKLSVPGEETVSRCIEKGKNAFTKACRKLRIMGEFVTIPLDVSSTEIVTLLQQGGIFNKFPGCESILPSKHGFEFSALGIMTEQFRPFFMNVHYYQDGADVVTIGVYDTEKRACQLRSRGRSANGQIEHKEVSPWKPTLMIRDLNKIVKEYRKVFNLMQREQNTSGTFMPFSVTIPFEQLCKQIQEEELLDVKKS